MSLSGTEHQPKCTERRAGRPKDQSCAPTTWSRRPVPRHVDEAPSRDSGIDNYRAERKIGFGAAP